MTTATSTFTTFTQANPNQQLGYAFRKPIMLGNCKRDVVYEAIVDRYIERGWDAAKMYAFGQYGIPKSLFGEMDEEFGSLFGGSIVFDKIRAAVDTAFDMWEAQHADDDAV